MAVYGLNFNRTSIPEHLARRFAKRIRVGDTWATLQGVCDSPQDRDRMLVQANNGRRGLHVETRRIKMASGIREWFGIYVY